MKPLFSLLSLLLVLAMCENTTNCTSPPVEIKLTSPRNFILYYNLNQNCQQIPKINYCKLTNCRSNLNGVCYQYEVYIEQNETICKQRCCMGIALIDMKLFHKFECNAVDFLGKNQLTNKNKTNLELSTSEIINKRQKDAQNYQKESQQNKSTLLIILSAILLLLIIGGFSFYCRFWRETQVVSDKYTERQVNTEKALSPSKVTKQQSFEKKWHLPGESQVSKQVKLLSSDCEICFNTKPNCSLPCNHNFHKTCLQTQSFECPSCKQSNPQLVIVRCQICLIYRYECNLSQLKESFESEDICFSCALSSK